MFNGHDLTCNIVLPVTKWHDSIWKHTAHICQHLELNYTLSTLMPPYKNILCSVHLTTRYGTILHITKLRVTVWGHTLQYKPHINKLKFAPHYKSLCRVMELYWALWAVSRHVESYFGIWIIFQHMKQFCALLNAILTNESYFDQWNDLYSICMNNFSFIWCIIALYK